MRNGRLKWIETMGLWGLLLLLGGCQSAVDFTGGQQAASRVADPVALPLPSGGLSEVQSFGPSADLVLSNALLTDGFVLKKASYVNVAQESVRLRLEGSGAVKLESKLKATNTYPIPSDFYLVSSVPLILDKIAILENGHVVKTIDGAASDYVDLAPEEKVEIRWLLHSDPNTTLCIAPQGVAISPVPISASFSGSAHISVKISRPSDTEDNVILDDSAVVNVSTPNWQIMAGERPFQCQGLLREEFYQSQDWCKAGGRCS